MEPRDNIKTKTTVKPATNDTNKAKTFLPKTTSKIKTKPTKQEGRGWGERRGVEREKERKGKIGGRGGRKRRTEGRGGRQTEERKGGFGKIEGEK